MINKTNKTLSILLISILSFLLFTMPVLAETEDLDTQSEENIEEGDAIDATEDEDEVVVEDVEISDEELNENLPWNGTFEQVAENNTHILEADRSNGHFIVTNKRTGQEVKSFPEPEAWNEDVVARVWQSNLMSPFMFSYVQFQERRDITIESNFMNNESNVDFELIDDGFKITYELPNTGFIFPVEVVLGEDFVETRVLGDEIVDIKVFDEPYIEVDEETGEEELIDPSDDDPEARLVSLRLFPFLGADDSSDKDGFLLLPDGPGILVRFKDNRANTNLFKERVYGQDQAFSAERSDTQRLPVRMPIFGIKSNDQAILGVVHEGDMYADITAAPSESFSNYNWATGEHLFRIMFFQPTKPDRSDGYMTYSPDLIGTTRVNRYYMLQDDNPGYVEMAERYREYLIEEKNVERIENPDESIKLHLNLLGGGISEGFLWDTYLPLTTIDQSMEILDQLSDLGIHNMSVTYHGWQRKGYGSYGGNLPVARQLGGNSKMKELADFVDAKGYSLSLDAATYSYNNTGKDKFRANRDGLRDLSAYVIRGRRGEGSSTLVSPLFMEQVIYNDLPEFAELGIKGVLYGDNIGARLSTDYNERYAASRHEVLEIQQNIFQRTNEEVGPVQVQSANFYALPYITHIEQMDKDYSYDLFVDDIVPFSQIAIHGLLTYSFNYGNMSGNASENFLKGIEYGAVPSYLVTHEQSHRLLEASSMRRFYSTNYDDWESQIISQYQLLNSALADVQDQFIVNHQEIAPNVYETEYENGTRIFVNYNPGVYNDGIMEIGAESFTVIEGGE